MNHCFAVTITAFALMACEQKEESKVEGPSPAQLLDDSKKRHAREVAKLKADLAEARDQAAEVGQLRQELAQAKSQIAQERLKAAVAARDALTELRDKLQDIDRSPAPVSVSRSTPASSVSPTIPEATPWVPPPSYMQVKLIKQRALEKYPNDFSMVDYEIRKQTEALAKLLEYNQHFANRPFLARAAKKYPDDYGMMEYEFRQETDAKQRVDAR
jgi:hypothetical protein